MPEKLSSEKLTPEQILEMVRPSRKEEEIKLTPEENKYLLKLLEEAKEAEKAKDYQKAIELYTKYKEKLLAIKERQEKEKRSPEQIIQTEDKEGRKIEFDLREIRKYWFNFYQEHNLSELAKALPETISLTKEQIERIKELTKEEGFNRLILLPPVEIQKEYLQEIKEETSDKPLKGLSEEKQYTQTFLGILIKSHFPEKIQSLNRPEKAYLLFLKDTQEVDEETVMKSAKKLRQEFKEKGLHGLTLPEYFIFQRDYTQRHLAEENPHPDTSYHTWLLDSELSKDPKWRRHIPVAHWSLGDHQIKVHSDNSFNFLVDHGGARPSAVFELS